MAKQTTTKPTTATPAATPKAQYIAPGTVKPAHPGPAALVVATGRTYAARGKRGQVLAAMLAACPSPTPLSQVLAAGAPLVGKQAWSYLRDYLAANLIALHNPQPA